MECILANTSDISQSKWTLPPYLSGTLCQTPYTVVATYVQRHSSPDTPPWIGFCITLPIHKTFKWINNVWASYALLTVEGLWRTRARCWWLWALDRGRCTRKISRNPYWKNQESSIEWVLYFFRHWKEVLTLPLPVLFFRLKVRSS